MQILKQTHYILPKQRLSFYYYPKINSLSYYKSKQKLYCFKTMRKSVPTKKLLLSRFILGRYLDKLKINNLIK